MPTLYGPLDLVKNELRNAQIQNLGSAPSSPVKGQLYFDTGTNIMYWWNGTAWIAAQSGSSLTPASTVTTQAVGDSAVVGTSANYAREDHKHGREAFGGAVTAQTTFGAASAIGVNTTLARSDHTHGTPTHLIGDHPFRLDQWAVPTAAVSMNGQALTNLPTTPAGTNDAASKAYVDTTAQGLDAKASVRVATPVAPGNITLSGTQTIDGIAVVALDRVLVKNQTLPQENGIYLCAAGAWTRATDLDNWGEVPGAYVWVELGTANADTGWLSTADAGGTLGTTAMPWVQFAAAGAAIAGNGLTKTGNTFDVVGDSTMTITADQIAVNTGQIATRSYVDAYIPVGMVKKYAAALTGTIAYATGEVVTHNLNTRDIQVSVVNGATPYQVVEVDWEATSTSQCTVRYNPNLGAGWRVVVMG